VIGSPGVIPKVIEKISLTTGIELEEVTQILQKNLERYLNVK